MLWNIWVSTAWEAILQDCLEMHRADLTVSHLLLYCPLRTYVDPCQSPRTDPQFGWGPVFLCTACRSSSDWMHLGPTPPASAPEGRSGRQKATHGILLAVMLQQESQRRAIVNPAGLARPGLHAPRYSPLFQSG